MIVSWLLLFMMAFFLNSQFKDLIQSFDEAAKLYQDYRQNLIDTHNQILKEIQEEREKLNK